MNDTDYHRISEEMLNVISDILEPYDHDGVVEVELRDDSLTIEMLSGKQLLLSKHGVTKQLWLSSPISGGLHFAYQGGRWVLADGRALAEVLSQELKQLAAIDVVF